MSSLTYSVKYDDHDFELRVYYAPAEEDTGTHEQFYIEEAFIGGHPHNVLDLLDDNVIDELKSLAKNQQGDF